MYQDHFNLSREPFSIAPDPEFLFLSESHNEALSHLLYGLSHGGFVLISGEVGTGKTTILRNLLKSIPSQMDVAFILNPRLTVIELLETVCEEFGLDPSMHNSQTVKGYVDLLSSFLRDNNTRDRSAVLIIDEAQNLSTSVLEQIRLLTNIETDSRKLLQIILIGQPELEEMLSRSELRQLAQRITARYRLEPLNKKETKTYIEHRLRVAGTDTTIFKDTAINTIFKTTKGIPRLINLVCDRALLGAYALDLNEVNSSLIRQSRKEVFGISPTNKKTILPILLMTTAVILAASVFFLYNPSKTSSKDPALANNPIATENKKTGSFVKRVNTSETTNSWNNLKKQISQEDGEQGRLDAYSELFKIWGVDNQSRLSPNPCETALNLRFRCLKRNGSWSEIDVLNTPVILELWINFDRPQYALLKRKTEFIYYLSISGQEIPVSRQNLKESWFGSYEILWKPPPGYTETLSLGDEHPNIAWLKTLLTKQYNHLFRNNDLPVYNQELLTIIEKFQRDSDLLVDGVIGPLTWIKLSDYLGIEKPSLES